MNHSVLDPETPKQDVKPIDSWVRWSWSDSPLVRQDGVRPTGTRCTGLGLLQALTEANVANNEILNRACLRWSSTTWSTNLSAISEGFPRQKAARHAAATTAGCNGIMTRTRTEATRTHSLMSPMLVTSDETGLESVGGEIVSGRADGSKGVRRRSTEDDCLAHGDWLPGEQHSNKLNPSSTLTLGSSCLMHALCIPRVPW